MTHGSVGCGDVWQMWWEVVRGVCFMRIVVMVSLCSCICHLCVLFVLSLLFVVFLSCACVRRDKMGHGYRYMSMYLVWIGVRRREQCTREVCIVQWMCGSK